MLYRIIEIILEAGVMKTTLLRCGRTFPGEPVAHLLKELRISFRSLLRSPLLFATCGLVLSLGIGGTVAVFAAFNAVVLRPLPFNESDRLVSVGLTSPGDGIAWLNQSPATFFAIQDRTELIESMFLWASISATVVVDDRAKRVSGMIATEQISRVLETLPVVGVDHFNEQDMIVGAVDVAILGHGFWEQELAGDPAILGTSIPIDGRPTEVIGVMPPEFDLMGRNPDVILAARFDRATLTVGNFSYRVVGRNARRR